MRVAFMLRYPGILSFNGFALKNKFQLDDKDNLNFENKMATTEIRGNFLYFIATNCPFIGYNMNFSPMSQVNDGCNEIMYSTDNEGGRCGLFNMLALCADDGDYFDNRTGAIKENL